MSVFLSAISYLYSTTFLYLSPPFKTDYFTQAGKLFIIPVSNMLGVKYILIYANWKFTSKVLYRVSATFGYVIWLCYSCINTIKLYIYFFQSMSFLSLNWLEVQYAFFKIQMAPSCMSQLFIGLFHFVCLHSSESAVKFLFAQLSTLYLSQWSHFSGFKSSFHLSCIFFKEKFLITSL